MPGRTITSYAWDFGDGSPTASGVQIGHTYSTLGVYTATLTVTDDAVPPHSATTSQQVSLDSTLPVADAGGPYVIERGDSLTLDASGTTDIDIPCGDTLTYEWALGGDNDVDAHGVSPTLSSAALDALGLTGGTYTILDEGARLDRPARCCERAADDQHHDRRLQRHAQPDYVRPGGRL